MTPRSVFRQSAKLVRHFASARGPEVLALQASPLLGILLGGWSLESSGATRPGFLLFGSLALTAHVFVFNDWVGHRGDVRDPRRSELVFSKRGIGTRQIAYAAAVLLIAANVAFALVGGPAVLIGAAISALGLLYSGSPRFGKSTPVAASLNHLLGGSLHFLLGWASCRPVDVDAVATSLFFGLVFAGGHLNQEVRDHEGDLRNGIRTSAVVFGCRRTILASLLLFTAGHALLAVLAATAILPRVLLLAVLLWPLQVAWTLRALRNGPGFETAVWMQRRYRLLFAVIGLAMLATAPLFAAAARGR